VSPPLLARSWAERRRGGTGRNAAIISSCGPESSPRLIRDVLGPPVERAKSPGLRHTGVAFFRLDKSPSGLVSASILGEKPRSRSDRARCPPLFSHSTSVPWTKEQSWPAAARRTALPVRKKPHARSASPRKSGILPRSARRSGADEQWRNVHLSALTCLKYGTLMLNLWHFCHRRASGAPIREETRGWAGVGWPEPA